MKFHYYSMLSYQKKLFSSASCSESYCLHMIKMTRYYDQPEHIFPLSYSVDIQRKKSSKETNKPKQLKINCEQEKL